MYRNGISTLMLGVGNTMVRTVGHGTNNREFTFRIFVRAVVVQETRT